MEKSILGDLQEICGLGKCSHSLYLAEILSSPSCAAVGDGADGVHVWVAAKIQEGRCPTAMRKENLAPVELEIGETGAEIVALWIGGSTPRIPVIGEVVVVQLSLPFFGKNREVPVYWWLNDVNVEDFMREMERHEI